PDPHPRTLNNPTPAPHKSPTSRQPRRPRRPRRRPAGAATPSNTQKSPTNKQPDDLNDGQQPRPHPRTCSNTHIARAIDTHHGHKATTSRQHTVHHTPSPETVAKHTPAKPDG